MIPFNTSKKNVFISHQRLDYYAAEVNQTRIFSRA